MVATSEFESDRLERLELIARLKDTAYAKAAREEIKQLRREYEANLGRSLMMSVDSVPQREIDYKRGFYRGMLWAFTALLDGAAPKLDKLELELSEMKELMP